MNISRRGFLSSILALGAAPAIVKAANLMPVFTRTESGVILPFPVMKGNQLLTIEMITAEALKILENNLKFVHTLPELDNWGHIVVRRYPSDEDLPFAL